MLKSLYAGVAGLKTHQTKMDVIGNNIANVNTYGFKAGRATFKDVFYQTTESSSDASVKNGGGNATQVGYGAMIGSIDVLHTRGGFSPTGQPMDIIIEGDGYLVAQDGTGAEMLTRVGNLKFDGSGNLVDANKNYICGYPLKRTAAGDLVYREDVPKPGTMTLGNMKVDFGDANGAKMNGWMIKVVESEGIAAGATPTATINGSEITITVRKPKAEVPGVAPAPPTPAVPGHTVQDVAAALTLALDTGLKATPPTVPKGLKIDAANLKITAIGAGGVAGALTDPITVIKDGLPITGGVDQFSGVPMVDTTGKPRKITMPGTMTDIDGDGVPDSEGTDVAKLTGIVMQSDGTIFGITSDEKVIPLGQILVAKVPNPGALQMIGSSYFEAKKNTGVISYEVPGGKDVGAVKTGGLESSNVDLSNEFADMITTQRGFQANSRIITAGDEMLQELANMKR